MLIFSPKFFHWIQVLSKFVSVQIVVQILGFASGVFLIRVLDQNQYAHYTIAVTMQGMMVILADTGVGFGLSAIGGKVCQDKYRFGQLINTGLQLRYFLGGLTLLITTPALVGMLLHNGASLSSSLLITFATLLSAGFQVTAGVLGYVLRLYSQIQRIQILDFLVAFSKITLLGLAYLIFLDTTIALVITLVVAILQERISHHWVEMTIDLKAPSNADDRQEIIHIIKQSLPNTLFFCLQGPITIWLISTFGNTQNVAEIGALGRLGLIFSVIGSVLQNLILPSFARCQSPQLLLRRYWQILSSAILLAMVLFSFSLFFPDQLLWLLGSKYAHLKPELIWIIGNSVLLFVANTMWSMNATKAWLTHIWIFIPATLASQIIMLLFIDISTVKGVIIFGMAPLLPSFFLHAYMTYQGLKTYKIVGI